MTPLNALACRPAVLAVREAFILALPVVVAMSMLQLALVVIGWWAPQVLGGRLAPLLQSLPAALRATLPFIVMIALSTVLARRRGLHATPVALTAFAALCGVAALAGPILGGSAAPLLFLSVPLGFLAPVLMSAFSRWRLLHLVAEDAPLSPTMIAMLRSVPAAIASLPLLILSGALMAWALGLGALALADSVALPSGGGDLLQVLLSTLATQVLWFFGLHGSNLAEELVHQLNHGAALSVTGQVVINGFMHIGGAGSTLGLVIAALMQRTPSTTRSISRIALPFAVLNINEVLIYGLPIALNPLLVVPFVIAPLLNGLLTFTALEAGVFQIADPALHWATPPLVAAWLASGGSIAAVALQVLCLVLDVILYLPFVRMSAWTSDHFEKLHPLFLDNCAEHYVQGQLQNQSEARYVSSLIEAKQAESQTRASVKMLEGGRFLLHYQPKVDTASGSVIGGEALLRLLDANGQLCGPGFLPDLMRLGLSAAIDDKVVAIFFEQLEAWRAAGFDPPPISINLDRDFLRDRERVADLIQRARAHPGRVEVEVTEHAFMNDGEGLAATVAQLQAHGIKISLDDFGAGYSSLGRLASMPCNTVKLDRAFVVPIETERGAVLVLHVAALCADLGLNVVAEGVETSTQLDLLQRAGVLQVQGFLTGRPMSADDFCRTVQSSRGAAPRGAVAPDSSAVAAGKERVSSVP